MKTKDGVMHETRPTPTEPHGAWGLEPSDPKIRRPRFKGQPTEGPRPLHVEQEPGEKMQMSPSGLRLTCLEADRVISIFLFDPDL